MTKHAVMVLLMLCSCSGKKTSDPEHAAAEGVERAGSDTANGGKPHAHGPEMIKIAPDMMRDLRVTTGPAVAYWNPSNVAKGNYTVKATFTEEKFMGLNNHPHPYGVFIAGNAMGTDKQSYLYCTAYGDGRFIVRGFSGDSTFQLNGRGEPNAAIHKASGVGASVTQEIALSVKGDKIECAINGQTVGTYDKSAVVGANKLTSTDGVYGIRFGHNTDAVVKGLTLTKK